MFETFFQRDLRLANQAIVASQRAAVSTSSALGYMCHHAGLFLWVLGLGLHDV